MCDCASRSAGAVEGRDCKMGARGRVGQQKLFLGWADVAVEFHPQVESSKMRVSAGKST